MKLLITGTPGTGKTTIARVLGKMMKCPVFNEMETALQEGIGEIDPKTREILIPEKKLEKTLKKRLAKEKNAVIEGHVVCETRLPVDWVILLRASPSLIERRLQKRKYSEEKIQDNVLCEGIDYCKKQIEKRYPEKKVIEVYNEKEIKQALAQIILEVTRRQKKP
jgi:adenylate kinase